jgi:hypothetical protein
MTSPKTLTREEAFAKFGNPTCLVHGVTTYLDIEADEGLWKPYFNDRLELVGYELHHPTEGDQ